MTLTALEQRREDEALGAAWRRAEAAIPEGWYGLSLLKRQRGYEVFVLPPADRMGVWSLSGATPTEALDALTAKLEAR